jgi:hypothetical protein
VVGSGTGHTEISANNESGVVRDAQTDIATDRAAVYLDGQQIGTVAFHTTAHHRWIDANGDHQVDPGELTVSFDRIRVSCP